MKPRVSMRTALWLVALAAIAVGWMADRHRLQARHHREELFLRNEVRRWKEMAVSEMLRDGRIDAVLSADEVGPAKVEK